MADGDRVRDRVRSAVVALYRAWEAPLAKEPKGVYKHDDGRPMLGRKLAGKSVREMRDLGLVVENGGAPGAATGDATPAAPSVVAMVERRRHRRALGDLRPVRRRAVRPLGGTRGICPAAERSRAADAARQLGDPRLGRRGRDGATLRALSTPDAETLGVRFNPVAGGAILEV